MTRYRLRKKVKLGGQGLLYRFFAQFDDFRTSGVKVTIKNAFVCDIFYTEGTNF